jgi:hypothetical protein
MKIRDRIKELRRVPAKDLIPNERNWRKHPKAQQEALRGILAEVGYADALIAYETPDGLKLIDGHLRASTTPTTLVPVLVLDVDEAEANKLLASLDPLAAMAESDQNALQQLLGDVQTSNSALAEMLAKLSDESGSENGSELSQHYCRKIDAPVYEPKGNKPKIEEMIDQTATNKLIEAIRLATLPSDIESFLIAAAHRHTVFHYGKIAEYYCHANASVQRLMEQSAMVIIDFKASLEQGFIYLTDRLQNLAEQEKDNEE